MYEGLLYRKMSERQARKAAKALKQSGWAGLTVSDCRGQSPLKVAKMLIGDRPPSSTFNETKLGWIVVSAAGMMPALETVVEEDV